MNSAIETQYFLESYRPTKITLNSSNNASGLLAYDEYGNSITSGLIGEQSVYKCTKFDYMGSNKYLLIHNSDNDVIGMIKGTYDKEINDITNIRNNFKVHRESLFYKINADIEYTEFNGNSVTLSEYSSSSDIIFKVYLNGEDVDYSRVGDTLTFTETNQFGNSLFVIYYSSVQTIGSVDIDLYYYSPYKHITDSKTDILLGYDTEQTGTISAGSNEITGVTIPSYIQAGDEVRLGEFVATVLNTSGTSIYLDEDSEESYTNEALYFTPHKLLANISNESETMNPSFYTFETKGIKHPIKIKEKRDNKFTFDYFIDDDMIVSNCNVFNYITKDIQEYIPASNRMRFIRANIETDTPDELVILTNVRKITSFGYSKGNPNTYSAELEFEDRLKIKYSGSAYGEGIYGADGYGGYVLVVS